MTADSATGSEIGFSGLKGVFTRCSIVFVDVPLTSVQACFEKSDFVDPVVPVFAAFAHCRWVVATHSRRKPGRLLFGRQVRFLFCLGGDRSLALVASLLITLKAFFRLGAVVPWPAVGAWTSEGLMPETRFRINGGNNEQTRNASFFDEVQPNRG